MPLPHPPQDDLPAGDELEWRIARLEQEAARLRRLRAAQGSTPRHRPAAPPPDLAPAGDIAAFCTALVQHTTDAVLVTEAAPLDEPGPRIVYVNPAFTRVTGYAAAEVIGRTPRLLHGPETERPALDQIRRALADGAPARVELTNYRKDGSPFNVEVEIVPVAGDDGPSHFVAVHRETTERRQLAERLAAANAALEREAAARHEAEAAFAAQHRIYEGLFAHAPIGLQIYGRDGVSLRMNEANRRMLGLPSLSTGVGEFNALTDPFMRSSGHADLYARAYAGEIVELPEFSANFSDPSNRWPTGAHTLHYAHLLFPIHDGAGEVAEVVSCIQDISARRQAEYAIRELNHDLERQVAARTAELRAVVEELEAEVLERVRVEAELRRTQSLLQSFLDHAPLVMALQDLADGRFLLANHEHAKVAGLPIDQIAGQVAAKILPPDLAARWQRENEAIAARGQPVRGEEILLLPGQGDRTFLTTKFPVADERGATTAIGVIAQDITQIKQDERERLALQRRLQEKQRLESIGTLAGGIAHDFNNLLAAVLGHAELLQLELPPGSRLTPSVQAIIGGAQRAAELTAQMLAYAGKGRLLLRPTALNELIRDLVELSGTTLRRHARVRLQLAEPLPAVEADATQLRQVVLNLLLNASEALGEEGGAIVVETTAERLDESAVGGLLGEALPPGHYVRLAVCDTGRGMDSATQSRMFEPFFSTKFHGRGLGLAAVHGIVRGHRGSIAVTSAPGQGATIQIWLPAYAEASPAAGPSSASTHIGRGTALVVDDEPAVRRVTRRMLEGLGYRVLEAPDGAHALAALAAGIADLAVVLVDLTMPGAGGDAIAEVIARDRPGTRVLLMSGYSASEIRAHHTRLPVVGVLQKPFSYHALRCALEVL